MLVEFNRCVNSGPTADRGLCPIGMLESGSRNVAEGLESSAEAPGRGQPCPFSLIGVFRKYFRELSIW